MRDWLSVCYQAVGMRTTWQQSVYWMSVSEKQNSGFRDKQAVDMTPNDTGIVLTSVTFTSDVTISELEPGWSLPSACLWLLCASLGTPIFVISFYCLYCLLYSISENRILNEPFLLNSCKHRSVFGICEELSKSGLRRWLRGLVSIAEVWGPEIGSLAPW